MTSTLKDRLAVAMAGPPEVSAADLARATGAKPPSVSAWVTGKTLALKGDNLVKAAARLNVNVAWLSSGRGPMRPGQTALPSPYRVEEAGGAYDSASEIELLDARGSCGGGSMYGEEGRKLPLIKEASWFKKYRVKPDEVMALFADGDSMADFIVDGDIVIFNRSQTTPRSGEIFLIDHPDGLRIKRMRRNFDGAWLLESLNPDKRRYPDETVTADQAEHLQIRGQFIYRQGG